MENAQVNQQVDNTGLLFQFAGEVEDLKNQLKYKQTQLEQVLVKLGVNTYHQDPVNDVVYKIYKPEGTFISFKSIDYKRTSLPGETGKNPLSKKEASEQGFVVKK